MLDSFPNLVASKMVALVERGAPRDFRDIYALCEASLTDAAECWQWWHERQRLAGSDDDAVRAQLAVETHLMRIAFAVKTFVHHDVDHYKFLNLPMRFSGLT